MTGHTGNCDLSEWTTPTQEGFPPKQWYPSGLTDSIYGSSGHTWWWPPYTDPPSHPRDCVCSSSPGKTGTTSASPVIINYSFIPAPAILFLPFYFLLLRLAFKWSSNYHWASVLGCRALAHHDHTWPYSNSIYWDHITMKWVICTQYGWIYYGTNYLFTTIIWLRQLNRFLITPEFSSYSEDDSNTLVSVLSSEDDCNVIELTPIFDLVQ